MPIYSYKCKKCGVEFDVLVGVGTGDQEIKCEKCNSKNVEKKFTSFAIGSSGSSSFSSSCPTGICPTGTCNLN
ncbi:MAG: zinc ribbon domain-containing protein [Candidatus Hydrogenedentota bacterium]